jgi:hypothetical protein
MNLPQRDLSGGERLGKPLLEARYRLVLVPQEEVPIAVEGDGRVGNVGAEDKSCWDPDDVRTSAA